jgi:hypothetical protein
MLRYANTIVLSIQSGSRGVAGPFGFDAYVFERLAVTHAVAAGGYYYANRVILTGRSANSKQSRQTS